MIEENFIRLYARDFVHLSIRAELGYGINAPLDRKLGEARNHAQVMDARKGSNHLAALRVRLREEAIRFDGRGLLAGTDPELAAERRRNFLNGIADQLAEPSEGEPSALAASPALAPVSARRRSARSPG